MADDIANKLQEEFGGEIEEVPLTFLGTFSRYKSMATDVRVSFDLPKEYLNNNRLARLLEIEGQFGHVLFLPGEEVDVDTEMLANLPPIPKREEDNKSPSQRLRSVLYVFWEQNGKPKGAFEVFYRHQMELFINHIKDKLN